MAEIMIPGDIERPRVVTFGQLKAKLTPVLASWGLTSSEITLELHDLWSLGAPAPDTGPDTKDDQMKRVLIHTQFNKWWREAMGRAGMTVTPMQALRTHGRTASR